MGQFADPRSLVIVLGFHNNPGNKLLWCRSYYDGITQIQQIFLCETH